MTSRRRGYSHGGHCSDSELPAVFDLVDTITPNAPITHADYASYQGPLLKRLCGVRLYFEKSFQERIDGIYSKRHASKPSRRAGLLSNGQFRVKTWIQNILFLSSF